MTTLPVIEIDNLRFHMHSNYNTAFQYQCTLHTTSLWILQAICGNTMGSSAMVIAQVSPSFTVAGRIIRWTLRHRMTEVAR